MSQRLSAWVHNSNTHLSTAQYKQTVAGGQPRAVARSLQRVLYSIFLIICNSALEFCSESAKR